MHRLIRICRLAAAVFAAVLSVSQAALAQSVVVETRSGRTFTGQLDDRTSPSELRIRLGSADMYIVRPIEWQAIKRLELNGRSMPARELYGILEERGWQSASEELPPSAPETVASPAPTLVSPAAHNERGAKKFVYPPVRSLQVEATVGRWTSGADNTGIVVRIYPLDAYGALVPVTGTLEVELIGQQPALQTMGEPFRQLARWAQPVCIEDFGSSGAVYQFPYLAWNPEIDLEFGATGAVHTRLSVAGQGAFDATASMVTLRPFSITRDRLESFSGERFFPQERTTRGVRDYGAPPGQ